MEHIFKKPYSADALDTSSDLSDDEFRNFELNCLIREVWQLYDFRHSGNTAVVNLGIEEIDVYEDVANPVFRHVLFHFAASRGIHLGDRELISVAYELEIATCSYGEHVELNDSNYCFGGHR